MTELLTSAQMRALEQAAIASGAVTGLQLMERAGAGVVEAVWAEWPELQTGALHAVVLCGPGNNGGDGFVVARLLAGWGATVWTFLWGEPDRLPPDAKANHDAWAALGPVRRVAVLSEIAPQVDALLTAALGQVGPLLVVDALFGIGLSRPVPRFDVIGREAWNAVFSGAGVELRTVAVDVPSGLCADSGRVLASPGAGWVPETALNTGLTVTFHRAKPGHYLADGPHNCGRLRVVDIGLRPAVPLIRAPLQLIGEGGPGTGSVRKHSGHKFDHGHALVLSGPSGKGGAARLAARGALRIGAGLVTLGCPPAAVAENAARLDAVMLTAVAGGAALAEVLADPRINAVCIGPGLPVNPRGVELVAAVLSSGGRGLHQPSQGGGFHPPDKTRKVVLDAGALSLLAREPALMAALHPGCVLTPHGGEFARLFPDIAERLSAPAKDGPAYSKVDATRDASARAGCVVLLKGADTVIAEPGGQAAINDGVYLRAAPWLATAGSGDVLAGFITGLLARGFAPFRAACIAAWLHVEAARSFGPGLIAEDLPGELPKVFRALGL